MLPAFTFVLILGGISHHIRGSQAETTQFEYMTTVKLTSIYDRTTIGNLTRIGERTTDTEYPTETTLSLTEETEETSTNKLTESSSSSSSSTTTTTITTTPTTPIATTTTTHPLTTLNEFSLSSTSQSTSKFTTTYNPSETTHLSTDERRVTPATQEDDVNVSSILLGLMLAVSLIANLVLSMLLYRRCRRQFENEEDGKKLYVNRISLPIIDQKPIYTDLQTFNDNQACQYESLSQANEAIYTNSIT